MIKKRKGFQALLCICGTLLGCSSPTMPEDRKPCPQSYEFGNYGCSRVVVIVDGPADSWPELRAWDVRVTPRRSNTAASANWSYSPGPGANVITLTRAFYRDDDKAVDTLGVTVKAALYTGRRYGEAIHPAEIFAIDSAFHIMRFVPVGSTPPTDSVRLTLRRVQ